MLDICPGLPVTAPQHFLCHGVNTFEKVLLYACASPEPFDQFCPHFLRLLAHAVNSRNSLALPGILEVPDQT